MQGRRSTYLNLALVWKRARVCVDDLACRCELNTKESCSCTE